MNEKEELVPISILQSIWHELDGTMMAPFPWKEMLKKIRLRMKEEKDDKGRQKRDHYHFHC